MTDWILASGSPRRRELLGSFDHPFTVVVADIDETPLPNESPTDLVGRLSSKKASAVAARHPEGIVIGADTVVAATDPATGVARVFGKPVDDSDARSMLGSLSGRTHQVHTGVSVVFPGRSDAVTRVVTTHVTFAPLSDDQIAAYVATGEGVDAAGSYKIQAGAGAFVTAIDGPFDNVVGLPRAELADLLGVEPPD